MVDSVTEARKRRIARLDGVKPPTARKAMVLHRGRVIRNLAQSRGGALHQPGKKCSLYNCTT